MSDEFLIIDDRLNRLGHLVNGIINYCFYDVAGEHAAGIITTMLEEANFLDNLSMSCHDLFKSSVGNGWYDRTELEHDKFWLESSIGEGAMIIRDIIIENGMYYDVTSRDGMRGRASLFTLAAYSPFRYLKVVDNFNDAWLA